MNKLFITLKETSIKPLSQEELMDSSTNNVDMGACSTNQHHETPRLCGGGCGFFGTAENRGLCSKCYNHYLQQSTAKFQAAINHSKINVAQEKVFDDFSSLTISGTDSEASAPAPTKSRCNLCRKKLGLLGFFCRCGGGFCNMHRHPEAHACSFDFKEAGKISIRNENPLCKSDKIQRRI